MEKQMNIFVVILVILTSTLGCNKDENKPLENEAVQIHYLKSALSGCNNKTEENIKSGEEKNDSVIIRFLNDTLIISVGLNYICCAPFITDCNTKNDSIFISIIDTCPNPYQECYCRCGCYYTFDYFFNSLSNKNYYWQILLSDPREENNTIFDMGTIDVGE